MRVRQGYYHLVAIVVVLIWGTTFISSKILIERGFSPQDIFFYRFFLAYCGIWLLSPRRLFADSWKDELYLLAAGMSGGSIFFYLQNRALEITQASNVSFIICTSPLLTTALTLLCVRGERVRRSFVYGSIAALVGVGLVIFNGSVVLKISPLGDFLTLLASGLWAVYSLIVRKVANRYAPVFVTRKIFFYGMLTILPAFLTRPLMTDPRLLLEPAVWGNLLFLGLAASLGCFLLWNIVLEKLGTIRASNYLYLNPLATLLGAFLILHERITPIALAGIALVLIGVYLATKKG